MKGLLINIHKKCGKMLLIVGLAPLATACAHTIDPTQVKMPTYEMPAAVVVQTSPALLNQNSPWQQPMPGSGTKSAYATYPTTGNHFNPGENGSIAGPVGTNPQGFPTGATVVRQTPITIERPTIVVNQPPIWVGNPPVAIPQPPVVMYQSPITVDQPSFVIHPPQVGFQLPSTAQVTETVVEKPKVEATPAPAPTKAPASNYKSKSSKKKIKKKSTKKAKNITPTTTLPPK